MRTDLSRYNNDWYQPGHPVKRFLWYYISLVVFETGWFPFSKIKVLLLRLFGAKVGAGVLIKPHVAIKYPWKLEVGDHVWIGERVWIDNLASVIIGNHACLSQGAYLLTGNHNYLLPYFDLIVRPIVLEDGVWVGAKATVCPGVRCYSHSVLAVGSVAAKDLMAYAIYQGNPAQKLKDRIIRSSFQ